MGFNYAIFFRPAIFSWLSSKVQSRYSTSWIIYELTHYPTNCIVIDYHSVSRYSF